MSKKKTKCKLVTAITGSRLSNMLNDVVEVLENKDWTVLGGADALADEELEALENGAIAAITMVQAMLGAFGAESRNSAWQAGPAKLAEGIMVTAVSAHRHFVVDAEDAGAQAQKPGVHVSVEFKG